MSISTSAEILFADILNRRATIDTFAQLTNLMHQDAEGVIALFNEYSAEDCRSILEQCQHQPPFGMLLLQNMLTHGHLIQSANLQRYLGRMMRQETEAQVELWKKRNEHLNRRLVMASQQLLALREAQKAQAKRLERYADSREALAALEEQIAQELAKVGEGKQLEKVVARLRRQLEREKEALTQQYESEKKALHQQHEAKKKALHRQHKAKKKALHQQHEAKKKVLQQEYEAQKKELERLDQQYENQEKVLAQKVAQLRQQYETKKKEMEQVLNEKLKKWHQALKDVELFAKLLDYPPRHLAGSREITQIRHQITELKRLLEEEELRQKIHEIYEKYET